MTRLYVASGDGLALVNQRHGEWHAEWRLAGLRTQCLAVDPLRPEHVYCGTFGQGLWHSGDSGDTWEAIGTDVISPQVMSVAVSAAERSGARGVVWAGTEPSALYRSEDGGQTWTERPALRSIPSAPTWSFPPRPWTSHVRWIEPDPRETSRLFVGIELGGVMRSLDSGVTWEDRKPGSQHDSHTLASHPQAPGCLFEAAGGGYAETRDGGVTWQGQDEGFHYRYLWGLAVDPGNAEVLVVSASPGPRQSHDRRTAEARMYRREGSGPWIEVRNGLPDPRGTRGYVLATCGKQSGVFYASPHGDDVYRSRDSGQSWERLPVAWPSAQGPREAHGLVAVE